MEAQTMISFRADAELLKTIDSNRGDLTRSQFIRRAVKAMLQNAEVTMTDYYVPHIDLFGKPTAGVTRFRDCDARMPEVCDICGEKRVCRWLECTTMQITGVDVCRECLKTRFTKISGETL